VFRAVRRVLRPDGVLWCNLGASYAGSGKGGNGGPASILKKDPMERQGFDGAAFTRVPGYKAKDLIQTPALLAEALRQDGWWLRSAIPWIKLNSMPESANDRPSVSLEWMFLLAKQPTYYWDPEAIRKTGLPYRVKAPDGWDTGEGAHGTIHRNGREHGLTTDEQRSGRNRRNGDWYLESLDQLIDGLRDYADELEAVKTNKGLLLDPDGEPLGLLVNPQALAAAHFASFPCKLVEPLIKASSRPGDVVLDPFGGSGTVGLVARALGRRSILIDLSESYVEEIARPRVQGERLKATRSAVGLGPLFNATQEEAS
jgi:hypothetical protein